jgi:flavin-dependent dehydrogenase
VDPDVAIVGAGPAGAVTALLLKRRRPGLRVLLLDAEPEPRHRPCGEFLGPHGVRVLAAAGLEPALRGTGAVPLHGLRLAAPHGSLAGDFAPVLGRQPPSAYGYGVRRERLDRCLQEAAVAAGVELQRGARARAMHREGSAWRMETETASIRTPLLIGADGRHSSVRREAGLDAPPARRRYALACRARGVAPPPGGERRGEMHLSPFGQVGLAPLGEGEVNLNLLLAESARPLLRSGARRLMRAAIAATPTLSERCRGARLGPVLATGSLPQGCSAATADGVALVGDAAGFWDPFTGDGMSLALRGAEALASCLERVEVGAGVPTAALARYAQAHARMAARKRALSAPLEAVLDRRRLAERLIAVLGASHWLGRAAAALSADYALP